MSKLFFYPTKLTYIILLIIISGLIVGCTASEEKPKNIIYILTDDQRFDELGFMNPVIETPHMDELATKGIHFKNFCHNSTMFSK